MKTKELQLFIKSGLIDNVEIIDKKNGDYQLLIFSRHLINLGWTEDDLFIETALERRRVWKSLDRLYKFIIESGWQKNVEIIQNFVPDGQQGFDLDDEA